MKVIKILMLGHKIQALEFVQMVSRISMVGQKGEFVNAWYPSVEVDMKFFAIQNKAKLLKYVMHAKHRRPDMKISKLSD